MLWLVLSRCLRRSQELIPKIARRVFPLIAVLGLITFGSIVALEVCCRVMPMHDLELLKTHVSSTVVARDGTPLKSYLAFDDRWRIPARLEGVSPWFVKAVVACEDKNFWRHRGIDLTAVARAVTSNVTKVRVISGASTISMQVAGFTVDPSVTGLRRKAVQAFRALQLERTWSKKQILEAYFTHASFGGNICGVEAAAQRYFNIPAKDLTKGQATLLAGIPQSPEWLRPDKRYAAARLRQKHVLDRMVEEGYLAAAEKRRIWRIEDNPGNYSARIRAPHLADIAHNLVPSEPLTQTTLDLRVQDWAERELRVQVESLRDAGVTNGAVVVIHNASGEVRAMVGSNDYFDRRAEGQVNAVFAARSPGSLLKPFLYAAAFDQGELFPHEVLYDVPQQFGRYIPNNYSGEFTGPVSAEKALAWSLNLPAMEVLRRVGVEFMQSRLAMCGVRVGYGKDADPGLALAIGSCTTSLFDLASAYAALSRGGQYVPASIIAGQHKDVKPRRLASAEACGFVLAALSDPAVRPPELVDAQLLNLPATAWKTGTSNGFKDAWTIGTDANFTVAVWMGNMNGEPSRALVGSTAAAPVCLRLMRKLKQLHDGGEWPTVQAGRRTHDICRLTGLAPGENCEAVVQVASNLVGGAVRPLCNIHQLMEIDAQTSFALCARCRAGRDRRDVIKCTYPREVAQWIRAARREHEFQLAPDHNPDCQTVRENVGPTIVSPARDGSFLLVDEVPRSFQKIEMKAVAPHQSKLFWFLNGKLVGQTMDQQSCHILPEPGRHEVRCTDQFGRADSVRIIVKSDGSAGSGTVGFGN